MFHIPTLCAEHAECAVTRVSEARFGVHFFVGNASVNSPLYCWALDGECAWLWKSLYARRNLPFTVAQNACAITGSHFLRLVEDILPSRVSYGVETRIGRLARTPVWEFAPRILSRCLDALCFTQPIAALKK